MVLALGCVLANPVWEWLAHLRSLALILIGLADNSVIPLPGSMDVFTIWLAASNPHLWLFYAAVATTGALMGGYLTYSLARKGGKEALGSRISERRAKKFFARFERWGFSAVAIPALLPPPFPMVPFLLAAGALQYSRKKFIAALVVGRSIRFLILARLGAIYGNWITGFFAQYYKPALLSLIAMSAVASLFALHQYLQYRKSQRHDRSAPLLKRKAA
jgi:membrane protein YqaA with SNARE-associated domain